MQLVIVPRTYLAARSLKQDKCVARLMPMLRLMLLLMLPGKTRRILRLAESASRRLKCASPRNGMECVLANKPPKRQYRHD